MNNTLNETLASEVIENEEELNLLSEGIRSSGLVMMVLIILLALVLIAWVFWNRTSPVVKMMQPVFLLLLCVGTIISALVIIPLGANDENVSNIDGVCVAYPWFQYLGSTITMSALFSKLWRVNQIFHAQGFQRKVVTVQDVLRPFLTLLGLNLTFLTVLSVFDPPKWKREPIDDTANPNNTYGYCTNEKSLGDAMLGLLGVVNFVALIILCVQAYRARDIKSEFSEARGVALALFSWLQSDLIVGPTEGVLSKEDADARYLLLVTQTFVISLATLLFIFGPLVAHHRQHQRRGSTGTKKTHVTGLHSSDIAMVGTSVADASASPTSGPEGESKMEYEFDDEQAAAEPSDMYDHVHSIAEMEREIEALRSRVHQLEADRRQSEPV